jgi:hypothetical protein
VASGSKKKKTSSDAPLMKKDVFSFLESALKPNLKAMEDVASKIVDDKLAMISDIIT